MELYAQIPIGPHVHPVSMTHAVFGTPTYHFNGSTWTPACPETPKFPHTPLTIATYNILHHTSSLPFRFQAILDALIASNANIICLQEVDDESLSLILRHDRIRNQWTWCSRCDDAVMESERNVVMLATEHFGFEWARVEIGGKHKACVVARISPSDSQPIVIAAVHLSAGRTSAIVAKRRDEISILLSYLRQHHATDEWIVIGDVNWSQDEDFPNPDVLVDVWAETIGQGGVTYDPSSNPLAAATTKDDRTPERYDRLFVRRSGRLVVRAEGLQLFGFPEEGKGVGSDHWGLKAIVHFHDSEESANIQPQDETPVPAPALPLLPTALTDDQLRDLCAEAQYFPSEAQHLALQKAVDTLRSFLTYGAPSSPDQITSSPASSPTPIPTPAVRLIVVPVGSFAMGYHTPESDVDCVVVGNLNRQTFWALVRCKIQAAGSGSPVGLRRFVKDALVQTMVLDVQGVKIDLQYCPAANLVERYVPLSSTFLDLLHACIYTLCSWDDLPLIPRDSPLFSLPAPALRTLNAHRDAVALLNALPSLDAFRLAHRALKHFLSHKGVFGARFGYLGGFHLALLLGIVSLQAPQKSTAAQLVRLFFHVYAHWDWDTDVVAVPIPGIEGGQYRRSKREPIVVLSVEKPRVNTTASANPNSVGVLRSVLAAADRALERGSHWDEVVCGARDGRPPFWQFVARHKVFVRIGVSYWGSSCVKGRGLVGWLESRLVGVSCCPPSPW
jgi:endonuclease/exonuclease/phosphatase family metal-dependent hydrolase